MRRTRCFEETPPEPHTRGHLVALLEICLAKEAGARGAWLALNDDDQIIGTQRGDARRTGSRRVRSQRKGRAVKADIVLAPTGPPPDELL
jgi:hypothetical protein